jgi:hypothetical protein
VVFGVIAASHFEPGWGLQSEGHREEGWLSCSGPCDRRRRHHHRDERHRQRPGAAPVAEPAAEVQESAIVESDAPTSAQPAPTSTASQTTSVGSSSLQVTDSADSAQQANPTVTTESPALAGRQAVANASSPASRIFAAEYTGAVSLEAGAVGFISPLFAVANFGVPADTTLTSCTAGANITCITPKVAGDVDLICASVDGTVTIGILLPSGATDTLVETVLCTT